VGQHRKLVAGLEGIHEHRPVVRPAGDLFHHVVLETLPSLEYTGLTGKIAFDDIGDALRDSAFVKACNTETGAWDFVTVATVG
jgi:branched-chain amino acid transport system substrate-binding protein